MSTKITMMDPLYFIFDPPLEKEQLKLLEELYTDPESEARLLSMSMGKICQRESVIDLLSVCLEKGGRFSIKLYKDWVMIHPRDKKSASKTVERLFNATWKCLAPYKIVLADHRGNEIIEVPSPLTSFNVEYGGGP